MTPKYVRIPGSNGKNKGLGHKEQSRMALLVDIIHEHLKLGSLFWAFLMPLKSHQTSRSEHKNISIIDNMSTQAGKVSQVSPIISERLLAWLTDKVFLLEDGGSLQSLTSFRSSIKVFPMGFSSIVSYD